MDDNIIMYVWIEKLCIELDHKGCFIKNFHLWTACSINNITYRWYTYAAFVITDG